MSTKRIVRDPKFIAEAAKDPVGSLAYTIMSSFGVTMDTVITVVARIVNNGDTATAMLAIASAVSIRGNVNHVDTTTIRAKYPELIVDGDRGTGDKLNFSALRMVGFAFAAASNTALASKVNEKAGNAISGGSFPDTPAGKINREAYASWAQADKDLFSTKTAADDKIKLWVNKMFSKVSTSAQTFSAQLTI